MMPCNILRNGTVPWSDNYNNNYLPRYNTDLSILKSKKEFLREVLGRETVLCKRLFDETKSENSL